MFFVCDEIYALTPNIPNSIIARYITQAINRAFPAALSARSLSLCPSSLATRTFTPTPVPIPSATMSICAGKASVRAFRAASPFSFMFDTNALSTMLYTACKTIEIIIGIPIESISFLTGITAILSCFTFSISHFSFLYAKKYVQPRQCWIYAFGYTHFSK